MEWWSRFKDNDSLRRTSVLAFICVMLYVTRSIISLVLLTFILTYLSTRLVNWGHRKTHVSKKILAIIWYVAIGGFLYIALTKYLPILFNQTFAMIESVFNFYQQPDQNSKLLDWIGKNISFNEIREHVTSGVKVIFTTLSSIGSMGVTFLLSLVLSFFFIIEVDWVKSFSHSFLTSKIGLFCEDVAYLGKKFTNTFGVVLEAQFLIAVINTGLTVLGLSIMKFHQLLSLALMVFILSLIPVAGVIISCIPLTLIGYSIGGVQHVVYILIMITVIHALESYILNPKLMSSKTNLPVFYVFVVLMFSEKFFGVWGLITGIPVFVFILDLLEVKHETAHSTKKVE